MFCKCAAPLLEEASRLSSHGAGGAGGARGGEGGAVLRSASDTAILTVAEAWELSLAAASASKDKRVKDVKNSSLKQQSSKKRQSKTNSDTSTAPPNDGLISFLNFNQFCLSHLNHHQNYPY